MPKAAPEQRKQKLAIIAQDPIAGWTKNGEYVTLYKVEAKDEEGKYVEDLRTFAELPQGRLMEFTLRRYDDKERGTTTWTILDPDGRGGVGVRIGELEEAVAKLTKRVEALESRLGEPEAKTFEGQDPDKPRGPDWI